mgnify:CR=1 FL=1
MGIRNWIWDWGFRIWDLSFKTEVDLFIYQLRMEKKFIFYTNWIHFPGFYVASYLSIIFFKLIDLTSEEWNVLIVQNLFIIPFALITYGLIFLIPFYLLMLFFDVIVFSYNENNLLKILIMEWIIISIPLIYVAFLYKTWILLPNSISFLITQIIRKKSIIKIVKGFNCG